MLIDNPDIDTVYVDVFAVSDDKKEIRELEKDYISAAFHAGYHDRILNLDIFTNSPNTYIDVYAWGFMHPIEYY